MKLKERRQLSKVQDLAEGGIQASQLERPAIADEPLGRIHKDLQSMGIYEPHRRAVQYHVYRPLMGQFDYLGRQGVGIGPRQKLPGPQHRHGGDGSVLSFHSPLVSYTTSPGWRSKYNATMVYAVSQ